MKGKVREMTPTYLSEPEVEHADRADLLESIRAVENRTGYTFSELQELARQDMLPNVRTQIAWQAVSELGDLVS